MYEMTNASIDVRAIAERVQILETDLEIAHHEIKALNEKVMYNSRRSINK
jgi:hypothetical protein